MTDKERGDEEQMHKTDPQEDEKDGNVFGPAFDKIAGDTEGGTSLSEEEAKIPGNQESIKDDNPDREDKHKLDN